MPAIDLTADKLAAVVAALRGVMEGASALDPLRAALAKLEPETKAPPPAKADKRARR